MNIKSLLAITFTLSLYAQEDFFSAHHTWKSIRISHELNHASEQYNKQEWQKVLDLAYDVALKSNDPYSLSFTSAMNNYLSFFEKGVESTFGKISFDISQQIMPLPSQQKIDFATKSKIKNADTILLSFIIQTSAQANLWAWEKITQLTSNFFKTAQLSEWTEQDLNNHMPEYSRQICKEITTARNNGVHLQVVLDAWEKII